MATVTARISVEAARIAVGVGRPQDHVVKELRVNGIPAVVTANGIDVERGFLHVYDEPQQVGGSLRVFEWTDEERPKVVKVEPIENFEPNSEVADAIVAASDALVNASDYFKSGTTPVNAPPAEKKRKK